MIEKPRLVPLDHALPVDEASPPPAGAAPISRAIEVMAKTLWCEARGEGKPGMEAVAAVIMNRVAVAEAAGGHYWWGHDVASVCQRPWQFSCWNERDPNRHLIEGVNPRDQAYANALTIARHAIFGLLADPTARDGGKGATHYHARGITPNWAIGQRPTATIGRHIFFRLVD